MVFAYSAGGLVTAVAPVVIDCKGLWIGWSGLHDLRKDEKIPEANPSDKAPTAGLLSDQVCLRGRCGLIKCLSVNKYLAKLITIIK